MTVAVTGGTGFLGAHVVRALLQAGEAVRVLVRPQSDRRLLEGLPVETVTGDLTEGAIDALFIGGISALIHCAGIYSDRRDDRPRLFAVNARGTEAVLAAAVRAGVRRAVHVSTMGTCTPTSDGRPATEDDQIRPGPGVSAYVESKIAAEDSVFAHRDLEVIVVNPAAFAGAFDRVPGVTGRRILDVLRGRFPHLPRGPVNYVPASSCATGILLALAHGRPGHRYLLGGTNLGPDEFIDRVAAAAGVRAPRPPLLRRLTGRVWSGPQHLAIDDTKARRELGYLPGDLDEAFREAARWFRAQGQASAGGS